MAKELGVGVRVYLRWASPDEDDSGLSASCKTGVIIEGPFLPGDKVIVNGYRITVPVGVAPTWNVALDGGGELAAKEFMLTPIDDDGETATTDEREAVEA